MVATNVITKLAVIYIVSSRRVVLLLMKRARDALDTAKYHIEKGIYDWAAFEAEQALQLFLKAKLIEAGVAFPSVHEIRRIMELLAKVNDDKYLMSVLKERAIELSLLEDVYITSRYIPKEIEREEAIKLLNLVEEIISNEGGFNRYLG